MSNFLDFKDIYLYLKFNFRCCFKKYFFNPKKYIIENESEDFRRNHNERQVRREKIDAEGMQNKTF